MNCKTCNLEVTSKYCPDCGRPLQLKRIDSHYLAHEIVHVLHFEKGIFFTIKQLLTEPGTAVREFISEDRSRLVKPVIFIIITSLIYSLIAHFFHIDSFVAYQDKDASSMAGKIFEWGDAHSGYINIIMAIFIAIWAKFFFRNQSFNLFEILILLCFTTGIAMLIFSLFAIIQGLTHLKLMSIAGVVGMIYCTWAIGRFFDGHKFWNYLKAFFAYVLGILTFSIIVVIVGSLIDILIAN